MADAASAALAGARSRCPRCGRGRLYSSYLQIAPECAACGADFRKADSGDGPAVFVVFIVGAIVVPVGIILQLGFGWPIWSTGAVVLTLTLALSLALLPVAKGVLFALQWAHQAGEGRLQE